LTAESISLESDVDDDRTFQLPLGWLIGKLSGVMFNNCFRWHDSNGSALHFLDCIREIAENLASFAAIANAGGSWGSI
jgi:hypothetical protein